MENGNGAKKEVWNWDGYAPLQDNYVYEKYENASVNIAKKYWIDNDNYDLAIRNLKKDLQAHRKALSLRKDWTLHDELDNILVDYHKNGSGMTDVAMIKPRTKFWDWQSLVVCGSGEFVAFVDKSIKDWGKEKDIDISVTDFGTVSKSDRLDSEAVREGEDEKKVVDFFNAEAVKKNILNYVRKYPFRKKSEIANDLKEISHANEFEFSALNNKCPVSISLLAGDQRVDFRPEGQFTYDLTVSNCLTALEEEGKVKIARNGTYFATRYDKEKEAPEKSPYVAVQLDAPYVFENAVAVKSDKSKEIGRDEYLGFVRELNFKVVPYLKKNGFPGLEVMEDGFPDTYSPRGRGWCSFGARDKGKDMSIRFSCPPDAKAIRLAVVADREGTEKVVSALRNVLKTLRVDNSFPPKLVREGYVLLGDMYGKDSAPLFEKKEVLDAVKRNIMKGLSMRKHCFSFACSKEEVLHGKHSVFNSVPVLPDRASSGDSQPVIRFRNLPEAVLEKAFQELLDEKKIKMETKTIEGPDGKEMPVNSFVSMQREYAYKVKESDILLVDGPEKDKTVVVRVDDKVYGISHGIVEPSQKGDGVVVRFGVNADDENILVRNGADVTKDNVKELYWPRHDSPVWEHLYDPDKKRAEETAKKEYGITAKELSAVFTERWRNRGQAQEKGNSVTLSDGKEL